MTLEVQYGTAAAMVYDSLISSAVPPDAAIDRLRPYVTGARVLDIGVGTGRVALPLAGIAAEVVGVDNSKPMLDEFRGKSVPANVSLVEADFRHPLPLTGLFDAAYSTLGSLACVDSREQLTAVFAAVHGVLKAGGSLSFEYYACAPYLPLLEQRSVTIPTPYGSGTTTFTTTLDDADVLTMGTRIEEDDAPVVEFSENILFIERDEVELCLERAGFTIERVYAAQGPEPYHWYTARSTN